MFFKSALNYDILVYNTLLFFFFAFTLKTQILRVVDNVIYMFGESFSGEFHHCALLLDLKCSMRYYGVTLMI